MSEDNSQCVEEKQFHVNEEAPVKQNGLSVSPVSNNCFGMVKNWFYNKGFGFITTSDGIDYFVHYSQLHCAGRKSLDVGKIVWFDVITGNNGRLMAVNVTGVGGAYVKRSHNRSFHCAGGGYRRGLSVNRGRGRGTGVCFNFQRGNCAYSENCKYKHISRIERGNKHVSRIEKGNTFNRGGGRGEIRYKRGRGGYRIGGGPFGRGLGNRVGICQNFQKGFCAYGSVCRFRHE